MTLFARIRSWLRGPETIDGFGQSFADDLRYLARSRACRRRPTVWRSPTPVEAAHWDAHPIVGLFGDTTLAVAEVDGRDWIVRENDWWGWPDPDRYPFFVMAVKRYGPRPSSTIGRAPGDRSRATARPDASGCYAALSIPSSPSLRYSVDRPIPSRRATSVMRPR